MHVPDCAYTQTCRHIPYFITRSHNMHLPKEPAMLACVAFNNVSSIHYHEDPLANTYELFDWSFECGKVLVR